MVDEHYVPAVTIRLLRFPQVAARLCRYLLGIGATMISFQDQIQIAGIVNSRGPRKVGWTDVVRDNVRIDKVLDHSACMGMVLAKF